uniref:HTH OST-type domain-containing protein n=1 Tax=Leersia perrieri TaxID=77586 RepID=A0A0D9XPF9_9ORYZ
MTPRGNILLLLRLRVPYPHRRGISSQSAAAGVGAAGAYGGGGSGGGRWREDSRAVRVSVWWDFQSCQFPPGANPHRVTARVTAALRAAGIRGPVDITAFGDAYVLPHTFQEALAATGVAFSHVPSRGKGGIDRSFMADLTYWIAQNPPPVHFFLISGDKGLANILHRLRMSNYNVLLACPSADSSVLCSAATIMWPWDALVKGLDVSPKHFNQPPDGISFSWYGQYKGPLDDLFPNSEPEDSIAEPEDSIAEPEDSMASQPHNKPVKLPILPKSSKDSMVLQRHTKPVKAPIVPKSIANGVRQILCSFPDGISLPDLRAELKRNNVSMHQGLFGFKNFSSLLQAMPDVVKFIDPLPWDRKQPAVVGVFNRSMEPVEQSDKTINSAQSSGEVKRLIESLDENPPSSHVLSSPSDILSAGFKKNLTANAPFSQSDSLSKRHGKVPPVDPTTQSETPASCMEADVESAAGTPAFPGVQSTVDKKGLSERICMLWNDPEPVKPTLSLSKDAIHSKGSNDLPAQDANNNEHNSLLRRALKIFSRSDNSDGNNLDSMSSIGSSFSNVSTNDHSDKLTVQENVGNTIIHSNKSVDMRNAEHKVGFGEKRKGIFSWVTKLWASGKPDTDDSLNSIHINDGSSEESEKESAFVEIDATASGQVGIELFKKSYFWDALQQYLSTPHGSDLVSKAKTREELAHGLQKQGWPLKDLDGKYLHQLVDLLISEKEWIKESSSQMFPFLVTLPKRRACAPSPSSKSNGLSSIFANGRPLGQCKHVHERSKTLSRTPVHVLPAKKGKSQARCKGGEFFLEELGPVSDSGKPYRENDKAACYHPPSHSDDEFSGDENHEVVQEAGRDAAQSSLFKIIDSLNTSKNGYSSKKDHNIDGIVGCSRINNSITEDAQDSKSSPRCSSVSSDEDEEKDKLFTSSALGSLQKVKNSSLPG